MELKGSLKNFPLPDIIQLIGMGRRSGVLTVGLERNRRAAIYFDAGEMTHAQYGEIEGADVIYQLFRKQKGNFQFASGGQAPKRSIHVDWMTVVMEAARRFDEELQEGNGAPGDDSTQGFNPAEVKKRMAGHIERCFGKKARKIQEELAKAEGDEERLLEFCDKVEKYIFVFIDNRKAKQVAKELRAIVRSEEFE